MTRFLRLTLFNDSQEGKAGRRVTCQEKRKMRNCCQGRAFLATRLTRLAQRVNASL